MTHTILVIRSAPMDQCVRMMKKLREECHPEPTTRWIAIVQDNVDATFRSTLDGRPAEIHTIPAGKIRREALPASALVNVDIAYVPFNNREGRGYGPIIRFLSEAGVRRIRAHFIHDVFEEMTVWRFYAIRIRAGLEALVENTVILILWMATAPLMVPYYGLAGRFKKKNL